MKWHTAVCMFNEACNRTLTISIPIFNKFGNITTLKNWSRRTGEKGAPSQTNSNAVPTSEEEADNLSRNTKKVKTNGSDGAQDRASGVEEDGKFEERRKSSYRDKVMGLNTDVSKEGDDSNAFGDVSDDDVIKDDDEDRP